MDSCNWNLLERADYEDFDSMKEMLVLYNWHKLRAAKGDSVALSILVDLHTAIYSGVLTRKQLEVVELYCMHNITQENIAAALGVNQRAISYRINGAVKVIQKTLLSGELFN